MSVWGKFEVPKHGKKKNDEGRMIPISPQNEQLPVSIGERASCSGGRVSKSGRPLHRGLKIQSIQTLFCRIPLVKPGKKKKLHGVIRGHDSLIRTARAKGFSQSRPQGHGSMRPERRLGGGKKGKKMTSLREGKSQQQQTYGKIFFKVEE